MCVNFHPKWPFVCCHRGFKKHPKKTHVSVWTFTPNDHLLAVTGDLKNTKQHVGVWTFTPNDHLLAVTGDLKKKKKPMSVCELSPQMTICSLLQVPPFPWTPRRQRRPCSRPWRAPCRSTCASLASSLATPWRACWPTWPLAFHTTSPRAPSSPATWAKVPWSWASGTTAPWTDGCWCVNRTSCESWRTGWSSSFVMAMFPWCATCENCLILAWLRRS